MEWREQWPDTPDDASEVPVDASEYPEEGDEDRPFRVALKDSACAASEPVAALRAERGEYVPFGSRRAAAAVLLDPDRPTLRFQAPAPNDPADVDAYLVKLRDPDPAPTERGPAGEGWAFRMTANQVGALCESLFTAYRYDPPPVVAYAARDLGVDPEAFRVHVNPGESPPVGSPDGAGSWRWDAHFAVRRRTPDAPRGHDGPLLRHYLAEVKHGSTSFERAQRAEMERIARDCPGVSVVVIRIRLDDAPQSYDLTVRAVEA